MCFSIDLYRSVSMNLLGIDWGEKRIGLAFADDLGLAYPLPAAIARNQKMRLQQIGQLIEDRKIDAIVVGYPINMNGSVGFKAQQVDAFIKLLEGRFDCQYIASTSVCRVTLLSKSSGYKKNKWIDVVVKSILAASLILQDYVEANQIGLVDPVEYDIDH